jgi:quinol monooxygenase YgiN
MAIVRINEFRAARDKASTLRAFLREVIDDVKTSPGCRGCQLLLDDEDESRLVIVESWDSIEAHQAAARRIPPERLAEAVALFAVPPQGRYYRTEA